MTDYAEEKEVLSTSTDLDDAIAVIRRFIVINIIFYFFPVLILDQDFPCNFFSDGAVL